MKPSHNILSFGINGSLRRREEQSPNSYTEHYLFNSSANLKAYSYDKTDFAYYGYNAANTRAYKLGLSGSSQWVNGQQQSLHLGPQQAMFYPNAYINFNQNGEYTKHYYNGAERIASRLGDNQQTIEAEANDRLLSRIAQTDEIFKAQIGEMAAYEEPAVNVPARGNGEGTRNLLFPTVGYDPIPAFTDLQPTGTANDIFYYHTNHLGSTAYVTDQSQNITQGFLYAPFGEITTEFNATFGNDIIPKYSFNAKELDEETGMYYYEARYYKPPVFTSRDAHFESYSSMSPYGYCNNNPLKYIDPTGKDGVVIVDDETQTLTIKATYFVHTEGRKGTYYTSKEIKLMNEEINNFLNGNEYSVTEGQYKGYSVKFDLQFKEGGSSCEAESLSEQEKFFGIPIGNSLSKGGQVSYPHFFTPNKQGKVKGGITDDNKILMNSSYDNLRNRIHEIFHTLFFDNDNASDGIGSYEHVEMPNQNDINMLINNDSLPKYKP